MFIDVLKSAAEDEDENENENKDQVKTSPDEPGQ